MERAEVDTESPNEAIVDDVDKAQQTEAMTDEAANGHSGTTPVLDPPLTTGEKMRDALLRMLDSPFFQYLGICVLIGVVGSGALFFFFLMGWQTLCRPRTDCQPRNDIYNISIQILNGFFTYMAVVSMPWRCTNFLHTTGWSCPRRENAPGHDLYGQATDDVWFHVPLRKRIWVLVFLLLNCLTQFANQATRIKFYSFELQNEYPGSLWVNVFFVAAFLTAGIGGALMGHYEGKVRATDPERFGPGPIELVRVMWHKFRNKETAESEEVVTPTTDGEDTGAPRQPMRRVSETSAEFDPTRSPSRRSVVHVNRSSMRMFAM